MVGFFSGAVLSALAPGLATYINDSQNSFRLIISPLVREEDQKAIEDGLSSDAILRRALEDLVITEDLLQRHTLRCLSWLLHSGRMEIKVALMRDALFHPKVWLFHAGDDVMVAHGSSNVTYAGIRKNIEQIAVSKSWEDPNQRYITEKLSYQFERLWDNKDDTCVIVPMPQAIRDQLLQNYRSDAPPTEDQLNGLYRRATRVSEARAHGEPPRLPSASFAVPSELHFGESPFEHQAQAVTSWCAAGYRGVLEMATGSGKTTTAMMCAYKLQQEHKPLLIVVGAPYLPLVEQWCGEVESFGLRPTNLTTAGGATQRAVELQRLKRRLRSGLSDVEVVVVSHDTLCSVEFLEELASFPVGRLLIADEAHHLGRDAFIRHPPEFFEYRLALSATPIRQYDEGGTEELFKFFGPVTFKFTLEEAIGRCLVEYDYYVHPVYLTHDEMDQWYDLTGKIKQNAWRASEGEPNDYVSKLLRDRRALLETASGKIVELEKLLAKEDLVHLKHTLIYASDKAPGQLDAVNRVVREKGLLFHQVTAEETGNREQTMRIIRSFQSGEIQVLTAKRVLDEGVNIPQICKAFILASTTVERQWIQRRGRLLRTCPAIKKTHSVIHDLLALPPGVDDGLDSEARALVKSELRRAQEFARLARNAGRPDGPLAMIDSLVAAAYS
jgi:superfamily II DNA or RNA helicase